jgi:glycosyltransferase involved in cell wall biosynthesis
MARQTLSILIPVYNEKDTVLEIVRRVQAASVPLDKQLVIVDDGSQDGTTRILRDLKADGVEVYFHEVNQGKAAAIRTAAAHATGDFAIIQDADLEYDPRDYAPMLQPLLDQDADVVFGSRFLGGPHRVIFFWHYLGNVLFTLLANILYDVNLTDMGTCYKAFSSQALKAVGFLSRGFGMEAEIVAKVCKARFRLYEVPISYRARTYAEGKKITWRDAFVYLWYLLKYRFSD